MKIVAIIQSRFGSTRLPGKSLVDIKGTPMLLHVIERTKKSKFITEIVVATTTNKEDEKIFQLAQKAGVKAYNGSVDDVLDRYYRAAKSVGAEIIVRITADCPILDISVTDQVISFFLAQKVDYASNTIKPTFPDGLDTEVFTFAALEKAWKEAKLQSEREHVTPYIWKNATKFKLKNYENDVDLSNYRWTVDEKEDLEFVRKLFELGDPKNMHETLKIIERNPEILQINKKFERNEGYTKSIKEDKKIR